MAQEGSRLKKPEKSLSFPRVTLALTELTCQRTRRMSNWNKSSRLPWKRLSDSDKSNCSLQNKQMLANGSTCVRIFNRDGVSSRQCINNNLIPPPPLAKPCFPFFQHPSPNIDWRSTHSTCVSWSRVSTLVSTRTRGGVSGLVWVSQNKRSPERDKRFSHQFIHPTGTRHTESKTSTRHQNAARLVRFSRCNKIPFLPPCVNLPNKKYITDLFLCVCVYYDHTIDPPRNFLVYLSSLAMNVLFSTINHIRPFTSRALDHACRFHVPSKGRLYTFAYLVHSCLLLH